jgi:hypothetical protein
VSSPLQAAPWSFGRIAKYAAVLLAILFIVCTAWAYWLFMGGVFSTSRFDPSAWNAKQTNETDTTCFRGGMANDIKSRVLKGGFSREAVKGLLGEPDADKPTKFEYMLGMCSGLRIDFDSLNVYFNESGKLTGATIVQH